ncbi:hypothetical protein NDU88_000447 [Pleurodeles waltl]|uniref:Uncharacterized protein n=1 Tax=Pleurodeles waltl TaxID=8319 RepID=A0AAV7VU52_PLEWA|nr:hypothetical protein NDU88_000447 [Pleurodeles waltl]
MERPLPIALLEPYILPNHAKEIIENKRRALQVAAAMGTNAAARDNEKGPHIFTTDDETLPCDDSQQRSQTPSVTLQIADTLI